MNKKLYLLTALVLFFARPVQAQFGIDGFQSQQHGNMENGGSNHFSWGRDTTGNDENIPIGSFMWKLEEKLGTVLPVPNDTLPHWFQNSNLTAGYNGEYNILGNLGSPRLSRIFMNRNTDDQFLFLRPFDFFYTTPDNFLYTNTKSPITNLSYHSCGSRETGEDRIRAYFATNINKWAGIGFKLDYLYGRGYYNAQPNSMFNASLYGYYRGERYNMHAWIGTNHMKMGENGGIESPIYITNPEAIGQSFTTKDIPTVLAETWNRNDDQTYYLTHRYNWGFEREVELPDSLKPEIPDNNYFLKLLPDSIRTVLQADTLRCVATIDSMRRDYVDSLEVPKEFIPVASLIHTFRMKSLRHTYYAYDIPEHYYTFNYYNEGNDVIRDRTRALSIKNTMGLQLVEGFNKWAKAGLTAYVSHEYRRFSLPYAQDGIISPFRNVFHENNLAVGGELSKRQGRLLHYNINGEAVVLGEDLGQFEVNGQGDLNFRLWKDTVSLQAKAYIKNLNPNFYYRHYHSRTTWWDNDLDKELRTRIEGTLELKRTRTRLRIGVENITNYTYFGMHKTPYKLENGKAGYSRDVAVHQKSGSVQVFNASLFQDFKWGIFHWDNEVTYQKSSDEDVLPLPVLSAYSNLYIIFRIAKVLRVEFGADARYFTAYYVPDYAPTIGQFAVQDKNTRYMLGNYPVCNVYANFHLKHCRFYAAVNHVNAGSGNYFQVPNYPLNPLTINFGLSWNFFN